MSLRRRESVGPGTKMVKTETEENNDVDGGDGVARSGVKRERA